MILSIKLTYIYLFRQCLTSKTSNENFLPLVSYQQLRPKSCHHNYLPYYKRIMKLICCSNRGFSLYKHHCYICNTTLFLQPLNIKHLISKLLGSNQLKILMVEMHKSVMGNSGRLYLTRTDGIVAFNAPDNGWSKIS